MVTFSKVSQEAIEAESTPPTVEQNRCVRCCGRCYKLLKRDYGWKEGIFLTAMGVLLLSLNFLFLLPPAPENKDKDRTVLIIIPNVLGSAMFITGIGLICYHCKKSKKEDKQEDLLSYQKPTINADDV